MTIGCTGSFASRTMKKRKVREKAEAKQRMEAAIECRYTCLESRCVVTVLKAQHAWGSEPQKGISQRDYNKMRTA